MFGFLRRKRKKNEEEEHSLIERDTTRRKREEQQEEDQRSLGDQIALGINANNLNLHSSAAQEILKGYSGYDGTSDTYLTKSLKSINTQKLNPEYYETNIKQQAGFSAEVFDVSRKNAKSILNEENIKYSRVDDVAGRPINETAYDITAFDANGQEILSESAQMKFLKSTKVGDVYKTDTKALAQALTSKQFSEKYPHATFVVAKDAYDGVKAQFQQQISSLEKQIAKAQQQNDSALEAQLNERLEYVNRVNQNLKRSEVTQNEAIQVRLNPGKMTAAEIATYGHEAGIQYAKGAATITGALTFARCAGKVLNGEMTAEDATKEVAVESAKSAGRGYLVGQANTAIAGLLKNSSKDFLRQLGNSKPASSEVRKKGSCNMRS